MRVKQSEVFYEAAPENGMEFIKNQAKDKSLHYNYIFIDFLIHCFGDLDSEIFPA